MELRGFIKEKIWKRDGKFKQALLAVGAVGLMGFVSICNIGTASATSRASPIDVTIDDGLSFSFEAGETQAVSTLKAVNNAPDEMDVNITNIRVDTPYGYYLSPYPVMTDEVNSKNFSMILPDKNNHDLAKSHYKTPEPIGDVKYQVQKSIETSNKDLDLCNVVYTLEGVVKEVTYKVEYFSLSTKEKIGENSVTGLLGTTQSVKAKEIPGYTTPSSQKVEFDTTDKTVSFYYRVKDYTITQNGNGGIFSQEQSLEYDSFEGPNPYDEYSMTYNNLDLTNVNSLYADAIVYDWMGESHPSLNVWIYIDDELVFSGQMNEDYIVPDKYKKVCNVRLDYADPDYEGPNVFFYANKTVDVLETVHNIESEEFKLKPPTGQGESKDWKFLGYEEIIQPTTWIPGDLNFETGEVMESTRGAYYSDFISVKAGETYQFASHTELGIRYYDKNLKYKYDLNAAGVNGWKAPEDGFVRYLIANYQNNKDEVQPLVKMTNINLKKEVTLGSSDIGNRIYDTKWEYNIHYNLDGGTLPLKEDKLYIYQDQSNPYGDDYETQYGTIDFTGVEEISINIPSQYMEQIKLYIDDEPFEIENYYGKEEERITIPDKYKKPCDVWLFYVGDDWYTPGIRTYILDAPTSYISSEGVEKLPIPTKEGYEFKGWREKNILVDSNKWEKLEGCMMQDGYSKTKSQSYEFDIHFDSILSFDYQAEAQFGTQDFFVYLDSQKIVNGEDSVGQFSQSKTIEIKPGKHTLKFEINTGEYNYPTSDLVSLSWRDVKVQSRENVTSIPKGTTGDINLVAEWEKIKTYELVDGPTFNTKISEVSNNHSIISIEFVDTKMPTNGVTEIEGLDLDGDGGVVGWYTVDDDDNAHVYISSQKEGQKMIANENCEIMFSAYTADGLFDTTLLSYIESVQFNNLFDTSNVINMKKMFARIGHYSSTINIEGLKTWNTSNVMDMNGMFSQIGEGGLENFSIDLSNWNTSNVTDMSEMFANTARNSTTFKLDLSEWDVSNVTDMSWMFDGAGAAYVTTWTIGDLSQWDVSHVTNMEGMFSYSGFNATTWSVGDLSDWDVSNVTNMNWMFGDAGYEATTWSVGDISHWDVSNVTTMKGMFGEVGIKAQPFTLDLSGWDVSKVTDMTGMFNNIGANKIMLPKNISPNVDRENATDETWYDASDNYKKYIMGGIPVGNSTSHTIVRTLP